MSKDSKKSIYDRLGGKGKQNQETPPELDEELEDMEDEVEEEISEAEQQIKEAQDKLLRAHAEMNNIRLRAERDVANAHKYALEKFVNGLLPVVDSLEQALQHSFEDASAKAIHEGIELTMKMFLDVLTKFGVEQINPINDRFNPEFHEAMTIVEHPEADSETVIEVFQRGYRLNGRLIRPARVVVAK